MLKDYFILKTNVPFFLLLENFRNYNIPGGENKKQKLIKSNNQLILCVWWYLQGMLNSKHELYLSNA